MEIAVTAGGPLFDGRGPQVVHDMLEEARQEIGDQGREDVREILRRDVRNATPRYENQIATEERAGTTVVHDGGSVYGPWLEGTSGRNRSTRFKGYAAFRRTVQALQGKAKEITEVAVRRHLGRLG